ncbi:MAG TPA: choice-of-anchor D domain-containing protein [Solirubrobacterales bacterium]|nr:choice-of-anchor D domain-containing protein [Solirubrobacterales bacterium]
MLNPPLAYRATLRRFALAASLSLLALAALGAANASAYLYWTESVGSSVNRTTASGAEETRLWVSGAPEMSDVAVDASHIYWSNFYGTIGRANLEGGEVQPEWIKGASYPRGVAVDAGHVYWANFGTNSIGRANLAGGEVEPEWIKGASSPRGLAVDAGHVYWASAGTESIGRANLAGGEVEPEWVPLEIPEGLAVDAGYIYWANVGTNSIGRANLAGGEVEPEFIVGATFPHSVAVDAGHVYWANEGTESIGRANLAGGEVEAEFRKVSVGVSGVFGLAVGNQTADPDPTSLSFGAVVNGSLSAPRSVTFTNDGSQNLIVKGMALGGADPAQFLLEAGGCAATVPPGGSCTVGVRFFPQAAGAFSATLTAQTNAETESVVSLGGTGAPPSLGPPNTSVRRGPAGRSTNRRPRFVFGSNQAGSTFVCRLDKQKFHTCNGKVTFKVKPGHHVVRVKAVGPTGLVDPTAAKRSFVVVAGKKD